VLQTGFQLGRTAPPEGAPRAETNRRSGILPASCDAWLTTSPPSGTSISSAPTSGSRATCPQCLPGSVRSGFQTARAKHAGAIAVCTDPPNAADAAARCTLRSALLVLQRLRETPALFHLDRFNVKHFHDLQLGDSSREAPCVKVDRIRGLRSSTTRPADRFQAALRRIGRNCVEAAGELSLPLRVDRPGRTVPKRIGLRHGVRPPLRGPLARTGEFHRAAVTAVDLPCRLKRSSRGAGGVVPQDGDC
jgi:hypothetical protein